MNASRRAGTAAGLALALVIAAVTGCTVSTPDEKAWNEQSRTALHDAASEVATMRLALATAEDDKVWNAYLVTVAADAEKALGTAEETLAGAQPPAGERDHATRLLDLLGKAADAVRTARVAAVDQDVDVALLHDLDAVVSDLEHAAEALG